MSSRRHGSLTLDNDMMRTLDKLKKWYGHRSRAEVVRFLASKALQEIFQEYRNTVFQAWEKYRKATEK